MAVAAFGGLLASGPLQAEPLVAHIEAAAPPNAEGFRMGTGVNPAGETIAVNSRYLVRDGKPWMPVTPRSSGTL